MDVYHLLIFHPLFINIRKTHKGDEAMQYEPIRSIAELGKLQEEHYKKLVLRLGETSLDEEIQKFHILVCSGTGCTASNSGQILRKLQREIKKRHLEDHVKVF